MALENGIYNLDATLNEVNFTTGYMVSLKDTDYSLVEKLEFIAKNKGFVLGLWENEGRVFVDISMNVSDLRDALALGKFNNQLAIYDIVNDKSIYL